MNKWNLTTAIIAGLIVQVIVWFIVKPMAEKGRNVEDILIGFPGSEVRWI